MLTRRPTPITKINSIQTLLAGQKQENKTTTTGLTLLKKISILLIVHMSGFEPRTFGVGSDRSTNCATTTSHWYYPYDGTSGHTLMMYSLPESLPEVPDVGNVTRLVSEPFSTVTPRSDSQPRMFCTEAIHLAYTVGYLHVRVFVYVVCRLCAYFCVA